MGSDRKALPVLILMTVFLFSGSPSFTSGSRARVTVPRIEEAQSPASPRPSAAPGPAVQLVFKEQHVVLDNGILQVTLSNPEGSVTGIQYNGIDNVLEVENGESNRGLEGTKLEVIVENEDQVELSFTRTWNFSLSGTVVPINVDKRFVLLRGSSGLYTYAVYEHLAEWPAFIIDNTRTVFKLRKDK
ncbi:hypothetical protein CRG98_006079 [Punica granatum]|uniref:Uncharacterized protein n=1 Tax=Punica granatum TaxID=22663 RepID=A0A2I0KYE2_PUNGR|nr:hypothetical protein CRG98_006079 [Punica granatum]